MNKIKRLWRKLLWEIDYIKVKLKYPNVGYHTSLVLASGITLDEIDKWVDECKNDFKDGLSLNEMRESVCEVEVSYWE